MDNYYIITDEDMQRGYMIIPDDAPKECAGRKLLIKAVKGDVVRIPEGGSNGKTETSASPQ